MWGQNYNCEREKQEKKKMDPVAALLLNMNKGEQPNTANETF